MGKGKLKRFADTYRWNHVFQPTPQFLLENRFELKGCWRDHFGNQNPIVLELGCGKGEYTIGLARFAGSQNFIGMDRKGARLWKGAKTAMEEGLSHVAFIRGNIEFIDHLFGPEEVDEIWITFPDPYPRPSDAKNRLTSSRFLNRYRHFLKPGGLVHLKTDNAHLFRYTLLLLEANGMEVLFQSQDISQSHPDHPILSICTYYESQFRAAGLPIHYLAFRLDKPDPEFRELAKETLIDLALEFKDWEAPRILKPRMG